MKRRGLSGRVIKDEAKPVDSLSPTKKEDYNPTNGIRTGIQELNPLGKRGKINSPSCSFVSLLERIDEYLVVVRNSELCKVEEDYLIASLKDIRFDVVDVLKLVYDDVDRLHYYPETTAKMVHFNEKQLKEIFKKRFGV